MYHKLLLSYIRKTVYKVNDKKFKFIYITLCFLAVLIKVGGLTNNILFTPKQKAFKDNFF